MIPPPADPLLPHRRHLAALPPAPPVRLCFAAAHVVLRESYRGLGHSLQQPGRQEQFAEHVDWPATMALRTNLDAHGFGIAEAMDTAQRFQLGWDCARELITRCGALRLRHGFTAGAGTDHLGAVRSVADLVDGVVHQCEVISAHGGIPTILPMPWLSQQRAAAAVYVDTYGAIFRQLRGPVFVHWLGAMFLPSLEGYFPGDAFARVMALAPEVARGCKLSLLDAGLELRVRRELLAREQIVLTGDDFHFGRLLLGGEATGEAPPTPPPVQRWTAIGPHRVALGDFSHALLGVFDAIAAPAGLALQALAHGDAARCLQLMTPCEALGQHVFAAPTQHYKAGLAFLAWLRGDQDNAMLLNREDLAREPAHYRRCAELALACGAVAATPTTLARLAQLPAGPGADSGL